MVKAEQTWKGVHYTIAFILVLVLKNEFLILSSFLLVKKYLIW